MSGSEKIQSSSSSQVNHTTVDPKGPSAEDQAQAVSLHQLQELLDLMDGGTASDARKKERKAKESEEDILKNLIDSLSSVLEKNLGKDPAKAQQAVASAAGLIKQITDRNPAAIGTVLADLGPVISDFLRANPGKEMLLLEVLSPLMHSNGEVAADNIKKAEGYLAQFNVAAKGVSPAEIQAKLAQVLGGAGEVSPALTSLYDQIKATLDAQMAKDPTKFGPYLQRVNMILLMIAARNPDQANAVLKQLTDSGFFKKVFALGLTDMNAVLGAVQSALEELSNPNGEGLKKILAKLKAVMAAHFPSPAPAAGGGGGCPVTNGLVAAVSLYHNDPTQNPPNLADEMGQALLFLAMFEQSVAKSQADQDKVTIAIGKVCIQSSLAMQKNIDNKVSQEQAEQAKAHKHHWWSFLIAAVVALLAVIVAALTAGVGAAIAAALVGAFMASPLMQMTVKAIATKIAADMEPGIERKYLREGKSPSEAHQMAEEKAQGIANAIASAVVIVAVALVSFGAGGIESVAEGATSDAMEAGTDGIEMTDMAAGSDDAAVESEEEASSASRYTFNARQGARVAAFQGLGAMGTTNIVMDIMMTDPEWVKKNPKLAVALDAIAQAIIAVAAMFMGAKAMSVGEGVATLGSKLTGATKGLVGLSWGGQMAEGGMGINTGVKNYQYNQQTFQFAQELAGLEKAYVSIMSAQGNNMETEQSVNSNADTIVKSLDKAKDSLQDNAGAQFDAVNSVIGS